MAASIALNENSAKRTGRREIVRWLLVAAISTTVLWLLGIGWYLHLALGEDRSPPHADAIVVLTGGPDRVDVALRLLADGVADRLLVSGAGPKTDFAVLAYRAGVNPGPLEQSITMGYAAHSTRGNALETAAWAGEYGVRSLVVVTSWFHMPRALVELRRAMPTVTVHPYPVGRPDTASLTHVSLNRHVIGEYHKFLAALAGLTALPNTIVAWETE